MDLHKKLKFLDIFSIATGAMISSGIFILPGLAYIKAGPSMIVGYLLGGGIACIGIISIIELSTAMPKAGGDYFFINKTFGPILGTISGILSWFALSLKSSLAIYGISEVIGRLMFIHPSNFQLFTISFISVIIFCLLNIVGVDIASKFEVTIVIFLLIFILIYIFSGIFTINLSNFDPFFINYENPNLTYTLTDKINIIVSISAFVFISYGGLLQVSSVSEEVINPEKSIPKAIFSSVISTTILYGLIIFVTIGSIPNGNFLIDSITPLADTATLLLGDFGFFLIITASMLAFISTANAGIMSASRYPLALSRDGLLPHKISIINKRFRTPIIPIVLTGIFIICSLLFKLENLAKIASAVVLLAYILTNLTVIILRESGIKNYQPTFKSPFYPWIQLFSIIVFSSFIIKLGIFSNMMLILFIFLGFIIYYKFGKENQQEYALLHLILKLTKGIEVTHSLERELRDIIHKRDNIELDDFDYLIKKAPIIEINEKKSIYDIIDENFNVFKEHTIMSHYEFVNTFKARENEATTKLNNFTAIPHIVLNNSSSFNIFIFRSKNGIIFDDCSDNLHAVFLFLGCPEQTKLHLKIIASFVFLAKEEEFEKNWMEAKNTNYLRDLILLSKRKRWNRS
ncbi:amino acid permease [uncultured Cetobacterium sp.]|uniref:amino acid permease n=1 Tax=uncultured Cetobacterium sp. TaxID=527638 RepID=UPI0026104BA3|nr:amino acid permease [uncultured Cetobacterium sp.]